MKKIIIPIFGCLLFVFGASAQSLSVVKGSISDGDTEKPLTGVEVTVKGTAISSLTDGNGQFVLQSVPTGNQKVVITFDAYETQTFPVAIVAGKEVNLGSIFMYKEFDIQDESVISLSGDELNDDEGSADNIAGLLQSSRDVFSRTAAYDFSSTFFRPRGYNSENGKLLINGLEMNKIYNGRPQWGNWGGLNDVQRNQELSNGLAPSEYNFGGIAGSTNINMRTSELRKGARISYAASNRSYTGRFMGSYSTGMNEKGWAFSVLAARRAGNEGYLDASLYDANSFFVGIEKKLNENHSLNLTAFYAQNRRGKSSPNTQEVYDLKGRKYNAYWGYQNGNKRNSRERNIEEPVIMLNHYWDISDKTTLNTNIGYQFGKTGNSRLNYGGTNLITNLDGSQYIVGGGANPDPTYYQKLPSYHLRSNDLLSAYGADTSFRADGQIDWNQLYQANISNGNSIYALYEDRNDDKQLSLNTILSTEVSDNITVNASAAYRKLTSENFANMLDLLGGAGYLDADSYATGFDEAQKDLRNPSRVVKVGDRFSYNFEMDASVIEGFGQAQFKYNKVDFYFGGKVSQTEYQRNGLYENGRFPNNGITNSFGKSEKLSFSNFGIKGGLTYKISGRHLLDFNLGYLTKAPSVRNSFSNSRSNNDVVFGLTDEKITSFDASYIIRTPIVQARFTGYYTKFEDATEISFFYADGISGITNSIDQVESNSFIQEVVTGLSKRNIGGEIGIEAQVTPTIKLKGVAAFGDYVYDNNPNLYLTSDNLSNGNSYLKRINYGTSSLKNYHVAGGPQRAFSLGFEYRDPNYWFFGATTNYFSNGYVDVSPITRTQNFIADPTVSTLSIDADGTGTLIGQAFNDYDPVLARTMLAQEKFDDYFIANAVGGKSWKVKDYYVGFFATIGNIFDTKYKTGGFEQSRNANFRNLRDDKSLDKPVFGSKYWYGYGQSYYLNLYVRF